MWPLLISLMCAWHVQMSHAVPECQQVTMELMQSWDGNWEGQFIIDLTVDTLGWELKIQFDADVSSIQVTLLYHL